MNQKRLTMPQQSMMTEITESVCVVMRAGAMTPAEARDVLRRLIEWLDALEAGDAERA